MCRCVMQPSNIDMPVNGSSIKSRLILVYGYVFVVIIIYSYNEAASKHMHG